MSAAVAPQRFVVAPVSAVPEGGRIIVEAGGREIGIFRVDGEFHAFLNRCPHLGGPLCEGEMLGLIESDGPGDIRLDAGHRMLTCPWHGWEFDIKTGQSYCDPARMRARRYPVAVEHGEAIVDGEADGPGGRRKGPYVAEVIPISVEDDYLVLTMRPGSGGASAYPATRGTRR